jgi:hypothetical protein
MTRRRMLGAALAASALIAAIALSGTTATEASWTTKEVGTGTVSAGTLAAPRNLSCSPLGLVLQPTFSWLAPAAGLTPAGYHWTVTNAGGTVLESGDVTGTSVQLPIPGLLSLGTYTFTVYAEASPVPGGWTSTTGPTGSYTLITSVLTLCSVP